MQLPVTLRLAYHGLQAFIVAGLIFFGAWIALVPANAEETAALGASAGTTHPQGLRQMRAAQAVVTVAPDLAYDMMAQALGPDVAPWMVRLVLQQVAVGNIPTLQGTAANRASIDGPRFIQVD